MIEQQVPALTIAGILFSLLVSWGVPTVLFVYFYRKKKAQFYSFLIGCLSFFVCAMLLEQMLHTLVLKNMGSISKMFQESMILYAVYGGLVAGVFEETGRLLAMKFYLKHNLNRNNAVMYGVGHGGIEAIVVLGLPSINNLISAIMVNSGELVSTLAEGSDVDEIISSLTPLWTLPSWQFFMGGIERLMAIILHIALSMLVYQSVKNRKNLWYYLLAVALHAMINTVVVLAANYGSLLVAEGITIFGTVFACWIARKSDKKIYKNEPYVEYL